MLCAGMQALPAYQHTTYYSSLKRCYTGICKLIMIRRSIVLVIVLQMGAGVGLAALGGVLGKGKSA